MVGCWGRDSLVEVDDVGIKKEACLRGYTSTGDWQLLATTNKAFAGWELSCDTAAEKEQDQCNLEAYLDPYTLGSPAARMEGVKVLG